MCGTNMQRVAKSTTWRAELRISLKRTVQVKMSPYLFLEIYKFSIQHKHYNTKFKITNF